VNPHEAPTGYVAKASVSCEECAFREDDIACYRAPCSASRRQDGCSVIFVPVDDEIQRLKAAIKQTIDELSKLL
jgi:C4-type Zn-finger protein